MDSKSIVDWICKAPGCFAAEFMIGWNQADCCKCGQPIVVTDPGTRSLTCRSCGKSVVTPAALKAPPSTTPVDDSAKTVPLGMSSTAISAWRRVVAFSLRVIGICAVAAVFLLIRNYGGPMFSSEEREHAKANWQYWHQLNEVCKREGDLIKATNEAKTPEAVVAAMQKLSTDLRGLSRRISALSVQNVDTEVVNYSAQLVYLLNESSDTASDLGRMIAESSKAREDANSFGTALRHFCAGFLANHSERFMTKKRNGPSSQRRVTR